jgi:hypothetical protein
MMRFYDRPHQYYAGIDLHARTMHLCVLDQAGFDPEELFGAAWWLTHLQKSCGAADERESLGSGCNGKEEGLLLPRRCFVA